MPLFIALFLLFALSLFLTFANEHTLTIGDAVTLCLPPDEVSSALLRLSNPGDDATAVTVTWDD